MEKREGNLEESEVVVRPSAKVDNKRSSYETVAQPGQPLADTDMPARSSEMAESSSARLLLPCQFGEYELLEKLGEGGMGVVYRARQGSAKRQVALKLVRSELLSSYLPAERETVLARFQVEVQAAARLDHDHVVTVFHVGEIEGQLFYAMKYVEGESLREKIEESPLEAQPAARYCEQIARALVEVHRMGILHRDVKPQNIMVDSASDRALLADFGLAKLVEGEQQLTLTAAVLGSPPYMSPEQASDSKHLSPATDIYSLGATLYHLVTGRPPFQAASAMQTLDQVRYSNAIAPRQLNPAIPRDLEAICLKCLEKEPHSRYADATALADDLERFLNNEPVNAKPPSPLQLFWRWYPKHAGKLLGAYFIISPMLWVFNIIGNLFQQQEPGLLLASPILLPVALVWICVGYCMLKYGPLFEIVNAVLMIGFITLPLYWDDTMQSLVLLLLISSIGLILQVGAVATRLLHRRRNRLGEISS